MNSAASDVSEDLPNSDEGVLVPTTGCRSEADAAGRVSSTTVSVSSLPTNILVATSEGLFTAEQLHEAGIKTTHIVIHDQSTSALLTQAPTTTNPLTAAATLVADPQTSGAAPSPPTHGAKRRFKYKWDASVHDPVLPVRCRNVSGELHKERFGSGGRGRCIKVADCWYTPSEFEAICGRASSKDWKRSIRYAGRTLQCLIEENILQPHATSCTCTACCDDNTVSGPIRLFTPYKRKKRQESTASNSQPDSPKSVSGENTSTGAATKEPMVVTLPTAAIASGTETLQVVTTPGGVLNGSIAESVVVTPVATPQTPRSGPTALDFSEQRHWWQLEEMVKNLVRQVQEIQKQVELVKAQSTMAKEAALQQLRIQMDNEKKEALNACRIEAQMNLSRAILEARAEKEIAIQQAVHQAKSEMATRAGGVDGCMATTIVTIDNEHSVKFQRCANCNREASLECTGCHKVSYCSTFCQRKDWQNHQHECGQQLGGDGESDVSTRMDT